MTNSILRLALLAFLPAPADVDAQYRHLCASIPSACAYSGPNAPKLDAHVCHGPAIGTRLKGTASCPSGSRPYYLDHGEVVDPVSNRVVAYVPLDNACDHPGICVDGPPPGSAQEMPMCCDANDICTHSVADCTGIKYFCEDGVCNDDGTVTCFAAVPLG